MRKALIILLTAVLIVLFGIPVSGGEGILGLSGRRQAGDGARRWNEHGNGNKT